MITQGQLTALVGEALATRWHATVAQMLAAADATTPLRTAHMLAQILHETAGLRVVEENLNYSAEGLVRTFPTRVSPALAQQLARNPVAIANHVYGGRLGNVQPGDGWRYRGRGFVQLTGRSNYEAYHRAGGADVVSQPDLAKEPPHAGLIAAWYWTARKINAAADADDVVAATKLINGGTNGLADRRKWLDAAKRVLAESVTTSPVGTFEVLVLHGITPELAGRIVDAALAGDSQVVLGPTIASQTGGRKLDVRVL